MTTYHITEHDGQCFLVKDDYAPPKSKRGGRRKNPKIERANERAFIESKKNSPNSKPKA